MHRATTLAARPSRKAGAVGDIGNDEMPQIGNRDRPHQERERSTQQSRARPRHQDEADPAAAKVSAGAIHCARQGGAHCRTGAGLLFGNWMSGARELSTEPRSFERSSSATRRASTPSRMICGRMKMMSSVRCVELS